MMTSTVGSTRRVRIVASNRAVAGVPPRTEESTLHLTILRGDARRHAAAFSFVVTRTLDRPVTCWKGPAVALGALPCGGQLWWAATELPFPAARPANTRRGSGLERYAKYESGYGNAYGVAVVRSTVRPSPGGSDREPSRPAAPPADVTAGGAAVFGHDAVNRTTETEMRSRCMLRAAVSPGRRLTCMFGPSLGYLA